MAPISPTDPHNVYSHRQHSETVPVKTFLWDGFIALIYTYLSSFLKTTELKQYIIRDSRSFSPFQDNALFLNLRAFAPVWVYVL